MTSPPCIARRTFIIVDIRDLPVLARGQNVRPRLVHLHFGRAAAGTATCSDFYIYTALLIPAATIQYDQKDCEGDQRIHENHFERKHGAVPIAATGAVGTRIAITTFGGCTSGCHRQCRQAITKGVASAATTLENSSERHGTYALSSEHYDFI